MPHQIPGRDRTGMSYRWKEKKGRSDETQNHPAA
jgi:hypothetical protein